MKSYLTALQGLIAVFFLFSVRLPVEGWAAREVDAPTDSSPDARHLYVQQIPLASPREQTSPVLPNSPHNLTYTYWDVYVYQILLNKDGDYEWDIYYQATDQFFNLTQNTCNDIEPSLSPDHQTVLYASDCPGNLELFQINVNGSGKFQITWEDNADTRPQWAPDGNHFVFETYRNGEGDVYSLTSNFSTYTRLTNYDGYDGMPSYSPDGSQVLFISDRSGGYRVWSMNSDGSGARQLSTIPYSAFPFFSPDGSKIAFSADGNLDGWLELWLMNADGSSQQMLHSSDDLNTDVWVNSWSPDSLDISFTEITFVPADSGWYWSDSIMYTWDTETETITSRQDRWRAWNERWHRGDELPPSTTVTPMPGISSYLMRLEWSGSDPGDSGIATFEAEMRESLQDPWVRFGHESPEIVTGIGGHKYFFRVRAIDRAGNREPWPATYDTFTRIESTPPNSYFIPRPAYFDIDDEPSGRIHLEWNADDPGGSEILSIEAQYRSSTNPIWTLIPSLTHGDYDDYLDVQSGVTYQFRVRSMDNAQNLEPWPPDPGDMQITIYSWGIKGGAADNRGIPLGGVTADVSEAFQINSSNSQGRYSTYKTAVYNYADVEAWTKGGYLELPSTRFGIEDVELDVYLPPADNLVQDWGFEVGDLSSAWSPGGTVTPTLSSQEKHTGAYSAALQDDAWLAQTVTLPPTMTAPTLSFMYAITSTAPGDGSGLSVEVTDATTTTQLITLTEDTPWAHAWLDLTDWLSQTITVTFKMTQPASEPSPAIYLDEVTLGSAHPEVWVEAEATPSALPGEVVTYTITVGNRGGVETGGILTQTLPSGLNFISASLTPTVDGGTLSWPLSELPEAGSPLVIQVSAMVEAGIARNRAVSSSFEFMASIPEIERQNNATAAYTYIGMLLFTPIMLR